MKTEERKFVTVAEWITKAGLTAEVKQCIWADLVKELAPSLHDFYTGYVQLPEGAKIDQDKINVHGGVTFNGELPDHGGEWLGFDMAHFGDEGRQSLEYAKEQCELMASQIT